MKLRSLSTSIVWAPRENNQGTTWLYLARFERPVKSLAGYWPVACSKVYRYGPVATGCVRLDTRALALRGGLPVSRIRWLSWRLPIFASKTLRPGSLRVVGWEAPPRSGTLPTISPHSGVGPGMDARSSLCLAARKRTRTSEITRYDRNRTSRECVITGHFRTTGAIRLRVARQSVPAGCRIPWWGFSEAGPRP